METFLKIEKKISQYKIFPTFLFEILEIKVRTSVSDCLFL